jgi:hypothetical protein
MVEKIVGRALRADQWRVKRALPYFDKGGSEGAAERGILEHNEATGELAGKG